MSPRLRVFSFVPRSGGTGLSFARVAGRVIGHTKLDSGLSFARVAGRGIGHSKLDSNSARLFNFWRRCSGRIFRVQALQQPASCRWPFAKKILGFSPLHSKHIFRDGTALVDFRCPSPSPAALAECRRLRLQTSLVVWSLRFAVQTPTEIFTCSFTSTQTAGEKTTKSTESFTIATLYS